MNSEGSKILMNVNLPQTNNLFYGHDISSIIEVKKPRITAQELSKRLDLNLKDLLDYLNHYSLLSVASEFGKEFLSVSKIYTELTILEESDLKRVLKHYRRVATIIVENDKCVELLRKIAILELRLGLQSYQEIVPCFFNEKLLVETLEAEFVEIKLGDIREKFSRRFSRGLKLGRKNGYKTIKYRLIKLFIFNYYHMDTLEEEDLRLVA